MSNSNDTPQNTDAPISSDITPPTCKCGHSKDHYMVSAVGEYSAWGMFVVMFGISYQPTKIRFKCRVCHQIFDETSDPARLKKHI